jgi:hypothetical protein
VGAHSLLAVLVIMRAHGVLDVAISLGTTFAAPPSKVFLRRALLRGTFKVSPPRRRTKKPRNWYLR